MTQFGGWNNHAKLINLSCVPDYEDQLIHSTDLAQLSNEKMLVEQLTKRFTPVQIQAIQSHLFHDR